FFAGQKNGFLAKRGYSMHDTFACITCANQIKIKNSYKIVVSLLHLFASPLSIFKTPLRHQHE
ncbi:MAG: hypothetical protein ABIU77_13315, partial [Ferruginibacter sp.]